MNIQKSAIIIGAGIGGLSTAIFLSRNGYKVDVYEKNSYAGGRCGQAIRDGHRFDIGATILLMPSIYKDVFSSMGLDFESCLELKPLETVYKIYFANKQEMSFSTKRDVMKAQLETFEPKSFPKFEKYVSTGYGFFQKSLKELLGRNFTRLSEFATLKNVVLLISLKTYLKHSHFVKRYFKNTELRHAFTFQNIYVGQNPFDAPALFAMLPAVELTEGALFPVGGMYRITQTLFNKAKDLGVNFYFDKPVSKISVSAKKVESVLFSDGSSYSADIIVANADLPYVYNELLPDKADVVRLSKKKYACSALVFHWGLSKGYPQLNHHSVFLSGDYQRSLDKIFEEHSLSENPSFYIHSPVRTDPTAAPLGQDSISIIIPIGHLDPQHAQNWNQLIHKARRAVLNRLKEIGLNDLEENIKFEICYPPAAWEGIFNVTKGSVFGSLKHSIMQMGYFRPHNRHDRYKNLYFVGGSTHPGNGVPLVLMSAKLTSERILKEF